jgi:opacity protein-like surface antigen
LHPKIKMMKQLTIRINLILSAALLFVAQTAFAQAVPTASQSLQLSAFGGLTGVFTGLEGGHNLSITAGLDLAFLSLHGFHLAAEGRGTYPIHAGTINSQKNVLGGVRVDRQYGHVHPYIDFLAGRGEIDYLNGGITVGPLTYLSTSSTVLSGGGGVDLDLSPHWAFKADYQYQHWDTPVTLSGSINPSVVTFGAVYRFDFNHSYKRSH